MTSEPLKRQNTNFVIQRLDSSLYDMLYGARIMLVVA